jgi:hypothetical protein
MAEKTIKFQQFWFNEEVPMPGGDTALKETIAFYGQTVDITDPYDLQRGEDQGAFMTDDEIKAMNEAPGAYVPAEAAASDMTAPAADLDWENASVDDMAEHIEEHNMTVNDVLAVGQQHPDRIDDLLQAEDMATSGEPRKGVTEGLAKIAERETE